MHLTMVFCLRERELVGGGWAGLDFVRVKGVKG
jgi:hypothetical protein